MIWAWSFLGSFFVSSFFLGTLPPFSSHLTHSSLASYRPFEVQSFPWKLAWDRIFIEDTFEALNPSIPLSPHVCLRCNITMNPTLIFSFHCLSPNTFEKNCLFQLNSVGLFQTQFFLLFLGGDQSQSSRKAKKFCNFCFHALSWTIWKEWNSRLWRFFWRLIFCLGFLFSFLSCASWARSHLCFSYIPLKSFLCNLGSFLLSLETCP